eukprot:360083-Chlamydomonas_euryale.AAC.3
MFQIIPPNSNSFNQIGWSTHPICALHSTAQLRHSPEFHVVLHTFCDRCATLNLASTRARTTAALTARATLSSVLTTMRTARTVGTGAVAAACGGRTGDEGARKGSPDMFFLFYAEYLGLGTRSTPWV